MKRLPTSTSNGLLGVPSKSGARNVKESLLMSKILSNLLVDLSEYTGNTMADLQLHMDECRQENKDEWLREHIQEFVAANEFYSSDENAIYQSTAWLLRDEPMCDIIESIPKSAIKFNWETLFDYGGGIGTPSLVLAETNRDIAITIADFDCPALSFAKWKAGAYQLDNIEFKNFCRCDEVPPIVRPRDCVLCIHMIGHSLNPFRTLAEIATKGKYAVWLNDFRVKEYAEDDKYPMHQRKPNGWDIVWADAFEPIGNHVFKSKLFGLDADIQAGMWINSTGWVWE